MLAVDRYPKCCFNMFNIFGDPYVRPSCSTATLAVYIYRYRYALRHYGFKVPADSPPRSALMCVTMCVHSTHVTRRVAHVYMLVTSSESKHSTLSVGQDGTQTHSVAADARALLEAGRLRLYFKAKHY